VKPEEDRFLRAEEPEEERILLNGDLTEEGRAKNYKKVKVEIKVFDVKIFVFV